MSLVDIQGWSSVPRGTPLFETLFAFENLPTDGSAEQDLPVRVTNSTVTVEEVNYPLLIQVLPEETIQVKVSFDAGRVPPRAAEAIIGHLANVLRGMAERPEACLGNLTPLSDAERRTSRKVERHGPALSVRASGPADHPGRPALAGSRGGGLWREALTYANWEAGQTTWPPSERLGFDRDGGGVMVERGSTCGWLGGVLKSGLLCPSIAVSPRAQRHDAGDAAPA